MARPRKIKTFQTESASTPVESRFEPIKADVAYDLILGLRRLKGGAFAGLWELTKLYAPPGGVAVLEVLSDATTKEFVINKADRAMRRVI